MCDYSLQAGFGCGLALMVAMAGLMLYTAYRIMTSAKCPGESLSVTVSVSKF